MRCNRALAYVFVLSSLPFLAIACTADRPLDAEPSPKPGEAPPTVQQPELDYRGPRVVAALVGGALDVAIHVNTGGHALAAKATRREDGHTVVELGLTAPGDGEVVTQALEVVRVQVALPAQSGPIHVRVQQVQRGVHYLVEPGFQLAAVVAR
jgi:hypothetical protein